MNKNLLLLVSVGLLIFASCRKEEVRPINEAGVDTTEQVGQTLKNGTVVPVGDTGTTTSSPGGDGTSKPNAEGNGEPVVIPDKEVLDPSDPFIRKPTKP